MLPALPVRPASDRRLAWCAPPARALASGAGRIVTLRMRPLTLAERRVDPPTVASHAVSRSLRPARRWAHRAAPARLRSRSRPFGVPRPPFPSRQGLPRRARRVSRPSRRTRLPRPGSSGAASRHAARLADRLRCRHRHHDVPGPDPRRCHPAEDDKPAKTTTIAYRDVLTRLWLLYPLPGWLPTRGHLTRLTAAPKHRLADPALAARLLAHPPPGGRTPPAIPAGQRGHVRGQPRESSRRP